MELSPRAGFELGGHTPCCRASHEQDAGREARLPSDVPICGAQHNLPVLLLCMLQESQDAVHKAQVPQHLFSSTYGKAIRARQKQVDAELAKCLCPKGHGQRANTSVLSACRTV